MAFGKAAGCLIFAAAVWAPAMQFPVRHEHLRKGCEGTITVDERGISFAGARKHRWDWNYQDIQRLKLSPRGISLLTYGDSRLRLGADIKYEFGGEIPAAQLYEFLRTRMDQRLVAEIAQEDRGWSIPVKHLRKVRGSEGLLMFGANSVVYEAGSKRESRTWRYSDIASISSSGAFQLTVTTLEKGFNFQLKEPIDEARYNDLWLQVERNNGRIQ
jgi:hypothetical protein